MAMITPAPIHNIEAIDEKIRIDRAHRIARAAQSKKCTDGKTFIIASVIAVAFALGAIFLHAASDNARFERAYALPRAEVIVHQGDTIDGIASENPVEGLSAHELGIVISNINEGNHSVPLMPGDKLMVPIDME